MAKTFQELRQQLIEVSKELGRRRDSDQTLSKYDSNCLKHAVNKIDAASQSFFELEAQS